MTDAFDFRSTPGHLVRRAHQAAVAIFMEETAAFDVTPVQFAILNALIDEPGEDQVTLASRVAFDAATFGSTIARMEAKRWVVRRQDPADRRRKRLWVTPAGVAVARRLTPAIEAVQDRFLKPLTAAERRTLTTLLRKLVDRNVE